MKHTELIRRKVKRAKHHISEFNIRIDHFFRAEPNPYPIIREEDSETGDLLFKLGKCAPIPEDFPTIIGDILQNLRTALDHLAWQLVLANGKSPVIGQTGFPIAEDSEMWLIANCKNGISSCEVARDLGITQKSAWFMLHRIRLAMQNRSLLKVGGDGGEVEADETFIGGKARNMHLSQRKRRITGTGGKDKAVVFGMLERGGEVRATVVPNRRMEAVQPEIKKHVQAGAALYTDEWVGYRGLQADYAHKVIDHAGQYVDGRVHTNGLENFWSLLKRGISGTYVSVEPFHLFRYLDEQAYRFNNRKEPMDDSARFYDLLSRVAGRRVTYSELTGARQF